MRNLLIEPNNDDLGCNVINTYNQKFHSLFEEFIKGQRSKGTALAYRTDINQFLNFTFNKEAQFVTMDMIISLTRLEAMKYHNHLKEPDENGIKTKNATIKRKINAVKSFLNSLKVDYRDINENIFDNCKLENASLDQEGYGNLDWDEAFLFIEYAHIEQMEGNQMAMILKLACITSIRLDTLLSLDWEENFRVKNEKGILVNYIDAVDKHTRHQTPISLIFYNELREKLGTDGKLFPNLHAHKVGRLLKEIIAYFEIDPKRNIKFHSFKKCGVNRVLEKTGDLTKAQVQGKHKSIVTTLRTTQSSYIEMIDVLTTTSSFTLDQDVNVIDKASTLSKEELLIALLKMSNSAQFELLRIINQG
ncbi:tyrosine-type recombinase/integrase [Paenibacillus sp. Soil750]|uniref:tyrosine-type recombinase/integrase n=1 Tax=Paenibacillus sp. Soil750 TaxID=1736398 RepID=UPI0006F1D8F2|nr:site-specific integrase [Paenibacillus sp. Soil750]KRE70872.1 hypothetical protein ASL11_11300 [Paenibacillus sp. Soil750]